MATKNSASRPVVTLAAFYGAGGTVAGYDEPRSRGAALAGSSRAWQGPRSLSGPTPTAWRSTSTAIDLDTCLDIIVAASQARMRQAQPAGQA